MDIKDLQRLGRKLRTLGSTRGDWLTYIDGTLPLLVVRPEKSGKNLQPACAVCAARRKAKAATMRKWRAGKK